MATPAPDHPVHDLARHRATAVGGAVALRIGALVVLAGALALALQSAAAFWLCLPAALLAAALARTARGSALGALSVAITSELVLAWRHVSPLPPAGAGLIATAASVAVLVATRRRLERERDQFRGVALSDPLTGVANRRLLLARADYELARHSRDRQSYALVMLDLDGFKRLNDRFGHAAGDEILQDVADALVRGLRAQDTVARLGGDEFCVLAPETDRSGVGPLAARIEAAVDGAAAVVDQLGASIGIAVFPDDGATTSELMEAADQRLLAAKRALYGRVRRRAA